MTGANNILGKLQTKNRSLYQEVNNTQNATTLQVLLSISLSL